MPPTRSLIAAAIALGVAAAPAALPARAAESGPVLLAQGAAPPAASSDAPLTRRPEELQADPMRAFDIDKDGTLDLAEVKSAAAARFDELNPDQDDSLDEREAAPVLQGEAFRQADGNGDGKISKAEYLAYVERMFLLANPDKDGTLDRAELNSEAGRALMRLLR
jgi:Ca2+-binding EF-hand superfamily protein